MDYISDTGGKFATAQKWLSDCKRCYAYLKDIGALSDSAANSYAAYKATLAAQDQTDTGAAAKAFAESHEAEAVDAVARLIANHAAATDQTTTAVILKITTAVNGL